MEIGNIGTGNTPTLATLPPDPFDSFADKVSGEDLVKSVADEYGRAVESVRLVRDLSAELLDATIVLLDGAHNPGGAKALSKAIDTYLSGRKKTAVVGMLADKDVEKALSLLIPKFDHIIAAAPDNPRAMEIPSLCEIIHKYQKDNANIEQLPDYHSLPEKIRLTTGPDDAVVVFGSLYLAGSLRPILKNFT